MSAWKIYAQAQSMWSNGDPGAALSAIATARPELEEIWSETSCLEASAYATLGNLDKACAVLETAVQRGTDNFYVFHQLHQFYRDVGQTEKSLDAMHQAHRCQGWPESGKNGYKLTHDYFSPNIPNWSRWFATRISAKPISCLEIGSWQGGSATWLLDRVVGPRGGQLTCIDTFEGSSEHAKWLGSIGDRLENIFDRNVAATGHASLCRKLRGLSQDVLRTLHGEKFDFIYVDGAHEAKFVIQDAVLCWGLIKVNGSILFDDVDFTFPHAPEQNTRTALDAFTSWFRGDLELIEQGRQLLVQRTS